MKYRAWGTLAGIFLAAGIGGCAITDKVHPRYDTINQSTEAARNESILLNIVRASRDAPLNFIAFAQVNGTSTLNGNAALPSFLLGPFAPFTVPGATQIVQPPSPQRSVLFSNSTLNAGATATTQFQISTFETKDFYTALLRPIDLPTLNYFIRQGYSRELLFWLFTESVEEIVQGKSYGYRYVPGRPDKGCNVVFGRRKCFADLVEIGVATGLTVETRAIEKPARQSQKSGSAVYARFCFDNLLATWNDLGETEQGRVTLKRMTSLVLSREHLPRCRTPWTPTASRAGGAGRADDTSTDELRFMQPGTPFGTIQYRIVTRSTFGIYRFLGAILAAGEGENLILTDDKDNRLLDIVKGVTENQCFEQTQYYGETYCIPDHAKNTKRIVQLLAQLLALQTNAQDLGVTPLVRVQQ